MSTTNEFDMVLKRSLVLLHLSQPNSATELRNLLDDEIRKRYGTEKMLVNSIPKKHLDQESNFLGRAPTPPIEIINLTNSPTKTISDSPNTILDSEDAIETTQDGAASVTMLTSNLIGEGTAHYDETATSLRDFGDLNCCVCSEMMFTASNRLIECSKCGSLYHQACHKPAITDSEISDELLAQWLCDQCLNKPSATKETGLVIMANDVTITLEEPTTTTSLVATSNQTNAPSKSHLKTTYSSSSSNSSSPFHRSDQHSAPPVVNTVSKKNQYSSKEERRYSHSGATSSSSKNHSTNALNPPSTSKRHSSTSSNTSTNSKSRVTRQYESRKRSHK